MSILPTAILPKGLFAGIRREKPQIQVSRIVVESAALDAAGVYARLRTRPEGLTTEDAEERLAEHGPNVLAKDQRAGIGRVGWDPGGQPPGGFARGGGGRFFSHRG